MQTFHQIRVSGEPFSQNRVGSVQIAESLILARQRQMAPGTRGIQRHHLFEFFHCSGIVSSHLVGLSLFEQHIRSELIQAPNLGSVGCIQR